MTEKYKRFLVDSNIFIYHLNGEKRATDFLKRYSDKIYISRITVIEVLSFDFLEEEYEKAKELMQIFETLDTTYKIALKCIENRKIKKIKIADNIIASTAMVYGLTLITRNIKDFKNLKIDMVDIFSQGSAI